VAPSFARLLLNRPRYAFLDEATGSQKLLGAGVLLENLSVAEDASHVMLNPFDVRWALMIPLGGGRARAYLFYGTDVERLRGERDTTRIIDECVKGGMPAEMYAGARPAGPSRVLISPRPGSIILMATGSC
jgi:hypothetical protein